MELTTWFAGFSAEKERDFNEWFALLQNTLDENQAANLFNLIDQHKRDTISTNPGGVHGIRFNPESFNLEVSTPDGWLVLIGARFADWNFIERLDRSWIEWEALGTTWDELEDMREVHQS